MALIYDEEEIDLGKLRTVKLQSALRKFAVVVAGRSLDLNIVTNPHMQPWGKPPAWSDASTINLFHDIENQNIMDVESIIRLKGLTIHELGHVLFTPRDRTELIKYVMAEGMFSAFNILEDNRIDNLMVARLSGVAPWLLHTVFAEFLATPEGHEYLLPLLHGRKYVPQKIRDLAASVYHQQEHVADIQRIIDKYITLNMARKEHQATALELVRQLHVLIDPSKDMSQHPKGDTCSPAKNGGSDMAGVREQDDALQRSAKQQAQQQQAQEQSDDDSAGNSSGDTRSDKQQLDEQVQQAQQNVSKDIYDDIKSMVQGMRSGGGHSGSGAADTKVKPAKDTFFKDVKSEMQITSRDFGRVLTELKALYDPAWVGRQSSGRLNARDFLMGAGLDESFDMWDDGRADVTDIECAIMLDISGSMYSVLDQAYDSMWAIKRALDSVNASTTVITFGDYSRVLYDANSRATIRRKHSWDGAGSTNPLHGIKYARDLLASSQRAIKLFIIITDGWWGEKEPCDATIADMRMSGVLTGQVYIADNYTMERANSDTDVRIDSHSCEVVKVVTDPADITDFARQLVYRQQRQLLNA